MRFPFRKVRTCYYCRRKGTGMKKSVSFPGRWWCGGNKCAGSVLKP